ncbi:MAG: hypothetical protein ABSH05_14295, partial [Bryobacteraceae bacterium]
MLRPMVCLAALACLGAALQAQSLTSVLTSLGTEWTIHEQLKPEWDWNGTWTRVGDSTVYTVRYRNTGSNALKTAEFRVTAESFSNGVLRFRHPQNGYYDIRLKPGERSAAGTMSWCLTQGCAMQIEFAGTTSGKSDPATRNFAGRWKLNTDGFAFVLELEQINDLVRGRMTPSAPASCSATIRIPCRVASPSNVTELIDVVGRGGAERRKAVEASTR